MFSLVSSIRRQGLAFVARWIVQCMVDNQRRSGAAIAGFESCWLEAGSFVWHLRQIDSYPHLTEDRDPLFPSTDDEYSQEMDKGHLAIEDELYNIVCTHSRISSSLDEGYDNIPWSYPPSSFSLPIIHEEICGQNFFFGSTIFFESREITLSAHEVATSVVMGRSLGTYAMGSGDYIFSPDF